MREKHVQETGKRGGEIHATASGRPISAANSGGFCPSNEHTNTAIGALSMVSLSRGSSLDKCRPDASKLQPIGNWAVHNGMLANHLLVHMGG